MQISKTTTDKIIVGSNDVSFPDGGPDSAPCGTAVLNGPVYVGKPSASPGYEGVLNVSSNSAPQQSLNRQPACQADLAIKSDCCLIPFSRKYLCLNMVVFEINWTNNVSHQEWCS